MTSTPHDVKDLSMGRGRPASHPLGGDLSVEPLVREQGRLERNVYRVPVQIDRDIARLKPAPVGVRIDELTPRQQEYPASWTHGT